MSYARDIEKKLENEFPISGLANCHVKGLFSLVLRERQSPTEGMVRIFYAGQESEIGYLYGENDFNVMPHNHRQDITLYRLFGDAVNVHVDMHGGTELLAEYEFKSAILGGDLSLKFRGFQHHARTIREQITEDGVALRAWAVHTVVAQKESAWVVKEGALAEEPYVSVCYSASSKKTLNRDGLYKVMSKEEIEAVTWKLRGILY